MGRWKEDLFSVWRGKLQSGVQLFLLFTTFAELFLAGKFDLFVNIICRYVWWNYWTIINWPDNREKKRRGDKG
jgi:hypothetical protein